MNTLISIAPLQGDYLEHHQIKGARWGILHGPPYPLARGKGPKKIKKVTQAAVERVEKQAEAGVSGAEKKKTELRKYLVEHPNKLYKHKEMFSREELEDILKEIDFDRKLKDVKKTEFKRAIDTVADAAKLAVSVKNITTSAVDIYKSARTINDILNKQGEFAPKKEESKQESNKSESKPKTEEKSKQESNKSENKPKTEEKSKDKPSEKPTTEEKKRRTARGKSFLDRMVQPQSDSYMYSMLKGNPSFAHSDKI